MEVRENKQWVLKKSAVKQIAQKSIKKQTAGASAVAG